MSPRSRRASARTLTWIGGRIGVRTSSVASHRGKVVQTHLLVALGPHEERWIGIVKPLAVLDREQVSVAAHGPVTPSA